jgi:hypothetical protein
MIDSREAFLFAYGTWECMFCGSMVQVGVSCECDDEDEYFQRQHLLDEDDMARGDIELRHIVEE